MFTVPMLILVIANTVTTLRIFTFSRGFARFKLSYSLMAALISGAAASQVVRVLLEKAPTSVWEALASMIFAVMIVHSRGNISCLLRPLRGSSTMKKFFSVLAAILHAIFGAKGAAAVQPAFQPDLPPVAWGAKVSKEFKEKTLEIADLLRLQVNWIMTVMAFETARTFSPSIRNPHSQAVGLIQFMKKTAVGLGTTDTALAQMTQLEQLDFVLKYFQPYRGKMHDLYDVYMAVLWPAAIGKPNDHVLWKKGTKAYTQNIGFDKTKKGYITKADAAAQMDAYLKEGLEKWEG